MIEVHFLFGPDDTVVRHLPVIPRSGDVVVADGRSGIVADCEFSDFVDGSGEPTGSMLVSVAFR